MSWRALLFEAVYSTWFAAKMLRLWVYSVQPPRVSFTVRPRTLISCVDTCKEEGRIDVFKDSQIPNH